MRRQGVRGGGHSGEDGLNGNICQCIPLPEQLRVKDGGATIARSNFHTSRAMRLDRYFIGRTVARGVGSSACSRTLTRRC